MSQVRGLTILALGIAFGLNTAATSEAETRAELTRKQLCSEWSTLLPPAAGSDVEPFCRESPRSPWYVADDLPALLDRVGRTLLTREQDPETAEHFFRTITKRREGSEAIHTTAAEWLAASRQWQTVEDPPEGQGQPKVLLAKAEPWFESGMARLDFPMDQSGNADFDKALSYLLPLAVRHPKTPESARACAMLAEIYVRSPEPEHSYLELFYFKEAIRRRPHTQLAHEAWQRLHDETHLFYTGSSGDHTPKTVKKQLERYRKKATPKGGFT